MERDGAGLLDAAREFAAAERIPLVGTTPLGPLEPEGSRLGEWLRAGLAGDLGYMARTADLRVDPGRPEILAGGALGAIVLGLPYDRRRPAAGMPGRDVAGYARGRDYHAVARGALDRLAARLREVDPGIALRPFCDTSPVMDKALGARAGLGVQGRNTLLVHPEHGSTFVVAGILVSRPLPPAPRPDDPCGGCRRCVDACPTGALSPRGTLDARRCLSAFTTRGLEPPPDLPRGDYVRGCDTCQDVCPFNRGDGPPPFPDFG